jgi:endonuclease/exonuclease/phosphatase family metal-dependent hydrolase
MSYTYARANGHKEEIGFEEGLAVLSKFPLEAPKLKRLGTARNPFVNRFALGTTVDSPCGKLLAFSVHLGLLSGENQRQLVDLQKWIEAVAGTRLVLIGGDFNASESSPQIKRVKSTWIDTFRYLHPKSDGSTHMLHWPWGSLIRKTRLDYIFLKQGGLDWNIVEARRLEPEGKPHSDHQAVLLRMTPGALAG